ncbi:hypothetical protein A4A49_14757 [Nicotiana attenuata]|uniref:Uncharacterized protein n=1 Tax=Nicotiana attenuata TaxID=49451 RepID=A0A1J6IIW2_NICAT|nr:hypothetical protein A4A49_14757 [Nicotiana attenuata]
MRLVEISSSNCIMKPFLLFLVLLVLSRIETNEATRTLDDTSPLLLPSLRTPPPFKTPSPNPGTGASVNMATTVTERNFVGRKEATRTLDETSYLLLPSLQTRPPVKTPSPNPKTGANVNMASRITERNFVGRKEAAKTLDESSHLLLPSLQTRPPVKTPSRNPKTGTSVNTATRATERNFAGRKEATRTINENNHLPLPSLQTRPPVKTPSANSKTGASVNMATRVSERNFVGRKEATTTLDETSHLLLPSLQTRPPVKTPSLNPGTGASVNMAARVTERNFVGRKKATRTRDETSHLLLPSLQTRPPVKTPTPNPGTGARVNMATRVAERNFACRKEVAFVPPLPPSTNASPQNNVLCDVFTAKSQK